MFGECHAHIFMDGINYREAVKCHKDGADEKIIREHLEAYKKAGISFVRDGGDPYGASVLARKLAPEYDTTIVPLLLPYTRQDIMEVLWEKALRI